MRPRHLAIALLVVVVWGLNFVFIHIALRDLSPLWLVAARFLLAAFPAVLFVRPPRIPPWILTLYGLSTFALQFTFLFTGMKIGVPAGLASLVPQVQVFFTMAFAVLFFGERPQPWQIAGALIAFAGIGVVAVHAQGDLNPLGVGLLLLGAMAWGFGNIVGKRAGAVNPFALVVWGSAIALLPLVAIALAVDGTAPVVAAAHNVSAPFLISVAYIVYGSTHVGYSLWARLLRDYPASMVAPFTLLVPVAGFLGSVLILGETLPVWKIGATILVIAGLALNVFGARLMVALRSRA